MGAIVLANCKCGFERRMALGGGMRNYLTYCAFPCYCKDCESMYVSDLFGEDSSCSECGSQNVLPYDEKSMRIIVLPRSVRKVVKYMKQNFWEKLLRREPTEIIRYVSTNINVFDWNTMDELGRDLILTDEKYLCPSCKNFSMIFSPAGRWD
jgi:hypothetical protein